MGSDDFQVIWSYAFIGKLACDWRKLIMLIKAITIAPFTQTSRTLFAHRTIVLENLPQSIVFVTVQNDECEHTT